MVYVIPVSVAQVTWGKSGVFVFLAADINFFSMKDDAALNSLGPTQGRNKKIKGCQESFGTIVIGEADVEVGAFNLLGKDVLLVEEEDDRFACKPFVLANACEDVKRLVQTICLAILSNDLVVLADTHAVDYCRYILELMNPFAPFPPLSSHINHPVFGFFVCVRMRKESKK